MVVVACQVALFNRSGADRKNLFSQKTEDKAERKDSMRVPELRAQMECVKTAPGDFPGALL